MNSIALHVNDGGSVRLSIGADDSIGRVSIGGEVYNATMPTYAGPYEANALFSEQVFQTAHKGMSQDFEVHAINYTEAPNEYGTTVTIGG